MVGETIWPGVRDSIYHFLNMSHQKSFGIGFASMNSVLFQWENLPICLMSPGKVNLENGSDIGLVGLIAKLKRF